MMPNANELTIIILYSNQKYGLLIPDSYTIRQIKKEIQVRFDDECSVDLFGNQAGESGVII